MDMLILLLIIFITLKIRIPRTKNPKIRIPRTKNLTTNVHHRIVYDDVADGDWKVWVTSTEKADSCEVAMVVYGDDGCTGPIILGKSGKLFQAGNQDEFKVIKNN